MGDSLLRLTEISIYPSALTKNTHTEDTHFYTSVFLFYTCADDRSFLLRIVDAKSKAKGYHDSASAPSDSFGRLVAGLFASSPSAPVSPPIACQANIRLTFSNPQSIRNSKKIKRRRNLRTVKIDKVSTTKPNGITRRKQRKM